MKRSFILFLWYNIGIEKNTFSIKILTWLGGNKMNNLEVNNNTFESIKQWE